MQLFKNRKIKKRNEWLEASLEFVNKKLVDELFNRFVIEDKIKNIFNKLEKKEKLDSLIVEKKLESMTGHETDYSQYLVEKIGEYYRNLNIDKIVFETLYKDYKDKFQEVEQENNYLKRRLSTIRKAALKRIKSETELVSVKEED